ncbi:DUF4352 domain-containing protein [Bacillus cereus]|uniref:DUF4352 domain-containing protein n=1 Tax=Bacillus cereus TaxID=1396 RepID=UPI0022EC750A|nr:DUF4352 domain-containing protein [Bacillus cereus]MDA4083806.1 DUF4352 domain-containing protein [Bacillus cereus]
MGQLAFLLFLAAIILFVLFIIALFRKKPKKNLVMVMLGCFILSLIIAPSAKDSKKTQQTVSSEVKQEPKKEEKIYKLNEIVKTKKIEVALTKFEEKTTVGNQYMKKDVSEGGTFLAVHYTMKNISDKPVSRFSFPSVRLIDEKDTKYDSDIDASSKYAVETKADNSKIASDLNPDIQVTKTKVFEISKEKYNSGKWYLLIDGKYKVEIK